MNRSIIKLRNITKVFQDNTVLKNINLDIKENEFVTLLGPSGCGKTTTLRIIGGFEKPTSGDVFFNDQSIIDVPPYKRKINTVFQRYALFTHLNVFENVAFGLRIQKLPEKQIRNSVQQILKLVNLSGFDKRRIKSLSGGQQQRVAIARALVNKPKVLLLDEPLGALDLKLRQEMQLELKRMQTSTGITFIYVTHDQEEALTMSDKIVVLNNGEIQQVGTPVDIYNEPRNAFVAAFIGESNIIEGIMEDDYKVHFANQLFTCVDAGFNKREKVDVVVRPEDIELAPSAAGKLTGVVSSVRFKGVHYEMIIDVADQTFKVHSTTCWPVASKVGLNIVPDNIHIMRKVARA